LSLIDRDLDGLFCRECFDLSDHSFLRAYVSWWAMYTGVGIFVLTGLMMVGEYVYRHFLFPDLEIPSVKSSIKSMAINCRSIWDDVKSK
jgi:hypothetical protein